MSVISFVPLTCNGILLIHYLYSFPFCFASEEKRRKTFNIYVFTFHPFSYLFDFCFSFYESLQEPAVWRRKDYISRLPVFVSLVDVNNLSQR